MEKTIFAQRLTQLLKQHNVTQKELCELVGVTEASMSRYMNTDRIPRSEILANIATALHTTSDYLLGKSNGDDEAFDFPRVVRLLARNSASMTQEQKAQIVNVLLTGTQPTEE